MNRLLSLALGLFSSSVFAQNTAFSTQPKQDKNQSFWIGAHAGMTSSVGLSFRFQKEAFALMLTTFPIYANSQFRGNIGIRQMYTFRSGERYGLFGYSSMSIGNHALDSRWTGRTARVNAGIGLGFDIFMGEYADFQILLGYGGMNMDNQQRFLLLPTIGAGMFFKLSQ